MPNAYFERALYLLHEVDQTARRYFEGLLKLTFLDTAVLALGLWTIGVSSPLLLGLFCAVLAWVPFVGSVVYGWGTLTESFGVFLYRIGLGGARLRTL